MVPRRLTNKKVNNVLIAGANNMVYLSRGAPTQDSKYTDRHLLLAAALSARS